MRVYAYCDGAVKGNGKAGRIGMGAVILYFGTMHSQETNEPTDIKTYHWGMDCDPATNNLAELLAIRNALHVVECNPDLTYLRMFSDSEWAVKAIMGEYRITHHVDLVTEIQELADAYDLFGIHHIRGHRGEEWNEKANELAQREAGTWKGK